MIRLQAKFTPKSKAYNTLQAVQKGFDNMDALASQIANIIREGNRRAGLIGVDFNEDEYAELRPATIATRGGSGPPLAPRYATSRVIRNFRVRTTVKKDTLQFSGYWISCPWMKYHVTGFRHRSGYQVPSRNAAGIRPKEFDMIKKAINKHFKNKANVFFTRETYGI